MVTPRSIAAALVLVVASLIGCDSDGLRAEDVVGSYTASTFRISGPADGTFDVLAAGGSLTVALDRDGSVTGRVHLPADPAFNPEASDYTFAGTYAVEGDDVVFEQGLLGIVPLEFAVDREGALRASFEGLGHYAFVLERP